MHRYLLFLFCLSCTLTGGPVISEFVASNESGLQDENGDRSDWVEIYNPDATPIDLQGWYLTDTAASKTKWRFPAVTIPPRGFLVVFCSNKNRIDPNGELHTNFALSAGGEYLGLIEPDGATVASEFSPDYPAQLADISYGVPFGPVSMSNLIAENATVRWNVPVSSSNPGENWIQPGFNDASWNAATQGIGFDRNTSDANFLPHIGSGGNLESALYNNTLTQSVFVRIPFTVDEASSISGLALKLRVDDGFVTWLNGQPVPSARHLAPATVAWNSAATGSDNNAVAIQYRDFDIAGSVPFLQPGNNLLAIQLLNVNRTSSDALLQVVLEAALSPGLAAGNPTGHFSTPTPGAPNGGVADMILPESPAIPIGSRVFSEAFTVALPQVPGWEIRYTLNGGKPTAASTLYTGPVAINSSSVLTAIYHDPVTGRIGLPVSAHYEKLESSLANYHGPGQPFRSALPIIVLNNLTHNGEFPNDDVKRPVRLQIFDRDSSGYASLGNLPTIATPANGKIRGSSSAGWPKKPYSIEFTSDTGATRDLSPLGLPAGEDFALISCYDFDRAFMRNAWIYEAARQAGFVSPRFRFVEVFFNQNNNNLDYNSATAADYRGVYLLVQSIRVGKTSSIFRPSVPKPPFPASAAATFSNSTARTPTNTRG